MSTKSTSSGASDDDTSGGERVISNVVSGEMNICDVSQLATETSSHTASDADAHHPDLQHTTSQEEDDNMNEADDASSKYIVHRLKELYHDVLGAEKDYHLHFNFCLPTDGEIKASEFDATPMVLLIGQYSTGKTTFLNHLLGEDFPGMHIGPEPTTDKFMALFHGDHNHNGNSYSADTDHPTKNPGFRKKFNNKIDDNSSTAADTVTDDIRVSGRLMKGNTLTVTPKLPFSSLSQFGSAFLNHFVGSSSSSPLLKRLTFIDTPGVLSGEKQRINRTYDFGQVAKWFADRSDLILLLFDAHKLDISDEFKSVIDTISLHNSDKIRCILNKADCVTREQLVRVYGSLMWSMGKIFDSPEVVRVYTGSYWNGALVNDDFERMFAKDEQLLVRELVDLPRCAAERKVNQMVNRIRLVKVHICILGTISKMTPRFFGRKKSREQILNELDVIMDNVRVQFDLSKGDMPNSEEFAKCLQNFPDFSVFPSTDLALISRLDSLIEKDIPNIVSEADNVADDVRMGKRSTTTEEKEENTEKKEAPVAVEEAAAMVKKPEATPNTNIFGLLGKIVFICILIISIVEGVYYYTFAKPALSIAELHAWYEELLKSATELPKVAQFQSSNFQNRPKKTTTVPSEPLASLPTKVPSANSEL